MQRDEERIGRVRDALRDEGLDALVCGLPSNILLLTGYWPVVGTSIALVGRDGSVLLVAPEDEHELAEHGWANEVFSFESGSLSNLYSVPEAVRDALLRAAVRLGPQRGRIGHESGSAFQPASYVSLQLFGADLPQLVREAFPGGTLSAADELLSRLRSVKTAREVDRIRLACRVAGEAFEFGAARLQPGLPETEAAELFQGRLATLGLAHAGVCRSGGSAFCMSGPHSAEAAAAYARSRTRPLERGDLVLMHCNSHVDGYWTDITRTYCLDSADSRQQQMSAAVLAARAAALQALHPGAAAAAADRAARDMISEHGFGDAFKHGTGHGVGFAAIDHHARPRLHPVSSDRLEAGMVFNIEPAIYIPAFGGLRHCDVAAVTATGAEVLTPFQASAEQFILVGREREQNPG